ncbi:hypothetical protein QBC34DRAFT_385317 [Podospora aff. communis PSN243]|uniref:Secreted protein n=1 Tax=Podospora aff. communis PSN243 TaxID=3040156 RepID=A0AAV9GA66_9PEZI|nr:hypothetical protein QBC34DRAFT_385317 [Podospora aff. communis PSN243]
MKLLYLLSLYIALAEARASLQPRQLGDLFQPRKALCNCNNPSNKKSQVKELCDEAGGVAKFGVFHGLERVEQNMCVVESPANAQKVFTSAGCKDAYGEDYNSFCIESTTPEPLKPPFLWTPEPPTPAGCTRASNPCANVMLYMEPRCHTDGQLYCVGLSNLIVSRPVVPCFNCGRLSG